MRRYVVESMAYISSKDTWWNTGLPLSLGKERMDSNRPTPVFSPQSQWWAEFIPWQKSVVDAFKCAYPMEATVQGGEEVKEFPGPEALWLCAMKTR